MEERYRSEYFLHHPSNTRAALDSAQSWSTKPIREVRDRTLVELLKRTEAQLQAAMMQYDANGNTIGAAIENTEYALETIKHVKRNDDSFSWPTDEGRNLIYRYKARYFALEGYLEIVIENLEREHQEWLERNRLK